MRKEDLQTLADLLDEFMFECSGDDLRTILSAIDVVEEKLN